MEDLLFPVIYEEYEWKFLDRNSQKGNYFIRSWKMKLSYYNIGLANNLVRSILEDNSGNLWIGTDYGLSKVGS